MSFVDGIPAKQKMSEIYRLCNDLFPDEFKQMFSAPRDEFRDWINKKTELNVDHLKYKHEALDAWLYKLKQMRADKDASQVSRVSTGHTGLAEPRDHKC